MTLSTGAETVTSKRRSKFGQGITPELPGVMVMPTLTPRQALAHLCLAIHDHRAEISATVIKPAMGMEGLAMWQHTIGIATSFVQNAVLNGDEQDSEHVHVWYPGLRSALRRNVDDILEWVASMLVGARESVFRICENLRDEGFRYKLAEALVIAEQVCYLCGDMHEHGLSPEDVNADGRSEIQERASRLISNVLYETF